MSSLSAGSIGLRGDELRTSLVASACLLCLYVAALSTFSPSPMMAVALPFAAMLVVFVWQIDIAFAAVIVSLFVNLSFSWYSVSVLVTLPLGAAILWRSNAAWVTAMPASLRRSIIIYGLCVVPSLLVSAVPMVSMLRLINVLAFLIVLFGAGTLLQDQRRLSRALVLFLTLALLNSLHVILEAQILHRRSLGFGGVNFVDYSALALCVTFVLAMTGRGFWQFVLWCSASVIAVALVLTQTRNVWISAFITLSFMSFYLIRFPARAQLARKKVAGFAFGTITIVVFSAVLALNVNPKAGERVTDVSAGASSRFVVDRTGGVSSSLVSRAFIWSTAINAFLAHPVTGIGVYAFPAASKEYSSIPPFLYQRYVEGLSPHQTHLAVLSETGLIGFIGFVVFIVSVLRLTFATAARAQRSDHRRAAVTLLTAVVYCLVSMIFTDAWLWGSLIVLFGLLLGAVVAVSNSIRAVERISSEGVSR